MRLSRPAFIGGTALVVLFLVGTLGCVLIEGWTPLDALYMTLITFTTVGYKEVHDLGTGGRVFTMFLMVSGVGVMLYILTMAARSVVEEGVVRSLVRSLRMKTGLSRLRDHVILCGFGRVGRNVAETLAQEGVPFIVVDRSTAAIAAADAAGYLYVQGDATRDEVLLSAGLQRARALVASVGNVSENVLITLTARGLNPGLFIVARSTEEEEEDKLRRAGADRVVSPATIGGRRIALSTIKPLAVDFFDTIFNQRPENGGLRLAEIQVVAESPLAGATIGQCCAPRGIQVLAVKKADGGLLVTPDQDVRLEPGDALIVVGRHRALEPLEGGR